MGRPKSKAPAVRSRVVFARLREAEEAGLKHLAARLGQTPSRIIRRLIREAITGGPDYFDDGLLELGRMHRELAAIGSNLNQLARAANRGAVVGGYGGTRFDKTLLSLIGLCSKLLNCIQALATRDGVKLLKMRYAEHTGSPSPIIVSRE